MKKLQVALTAWAVGMMLMVVGPTYAADKGDLAEKHIVLQISDGSPEKQTLVLNVANNLLKYYGPDRVKVEVVAFGPGMNMLLANNENKDRIQSLDASGVRFSACENTLAAMTKKLGHKPQIVSEAVPVPAGIVRIADLSSQGYTLVRP